MCVGAPKLGKRQSLYDIDEEQKKKYVQRLPQLNEKRIQAITKHIVYQFLDKLAEYIFTNGKIYTMDQKNPEVQAVAIRGGRILVAGQMADVVAFRGENTKIIDLNGRTMFPGFIDPHMHMFFTILNHWLDLSPFINSNLEQVKQKIIKKVSAAAEGEWVLGQLFDPTIMSGEFDVSRQSLDKISDKVPIFIFEANGHVAHVNSAALNAAGITKDTPDPDHGRFMKNQNGQLTGQLQETAFLQLRRFLFKDSTSYHDNFKNFLQDCSKQGCTTLNDCGIGLVDPRADLSVLLGVMQENPPVRYSGYLVSTAWNTWMEQKMVPEWDDYHLRIHGVKCWADGSLQGGSGFVRENYLKQKWGKGHPNYTKQQLKHSVKLAHDLGWQVGIHANGDAGIDLALDVLEEVQKQNPQQDLRHRIQHCTVCHKDQFERMKRIGVSPSFLIGHIYYYGQAFVNDILGKERAYKIDSMRTAINCGLRATMHSDFNCQPIGPLRYIHNAVTRKIKVSGEILNVAECITPYQAMKGVTIDAAWQCHMDDIVGSIQENKMADFVILSDDPFKCNPNDIINIKISETWMDGILRYKNKEIQTIGSIKSDFSFKSQNSFSEAKSTDSPTKQPKLDKASSIEKIQIESTQNQQKQISSKTAFEKKTSV